MTDCVVVQPIAEVGLAMLRGAGLSIHVAADPTLEAMRSHLADAKVVITRNAGFSATAMNAAPHLQVIGSHGAGVDAIDLAVARERGIVVVNTPGANARSVAELSFALILACAKKLGAADRAVRTGNFGFREHSDTVELGGRTLGLVGFGHVARHVARLGHAFAMNVIAVSQHAGDEDLRSCDIERSPDLDALCAASDVISLHARPSGTPLFDAQRLGRLKPGTILINTARGALVDETALARTLHERRIAAGIDVFSVEPPLPDHPLLNAPNLVLTPHIGGSTQEALERTAIAVVDQILSVLRGESPVHRVI